VLTSEEPELTARTKVVSKSEWLGFPPVCSRRDQRETPLLQSFRNALFQFSETERGSDVLALLQLDGFAEAEPSLYDGILTRMREIEGRR